MEHFYALSVARRPLLRDAQRASAVLGLLLMLTDGLAQNSQFNFDAHGSLQTQLVAPSVAPQIIGQPQNQVVAPGSTAGFSVVLANTIGATYQWKYNGTPLAGATADSLVLPNASAAMEGQYTVAVTNSAGYAISAGAALFMDADGDGLPDSWELASFGNLNQNGTGDFDGDGVSNFQEYLDVTDPTNANSVLYQLRVLSDGGKIDISPSQSRYSKGTIVNLSAGTVFPLDFFRGWTGDTNYTGSVISLAMTTNRSVFAHFGYYDLTWTNPASGNWDVASNWSPNFVPTTNDSAFINGSVTVTLNRDNEVASLKLGGSGTPNLAVTGTLVVHESLDWLAGTMSGSGRTIISSNALVNLANSANVVLVGRTLENGGLLTLSGAGGVTFNSAVFTNRPGATFEVHGSGSFGWSGGANRFDNAGIFHRTASGTFTVPNGISFNNDGTVENQSGTFLLGGGGSASGTFTIPSGSTIEFSGNTYNAGPSSVVSGGGNLRVSGATVNLNGVVALTGSHTFTAGAANMNGYYFCTNNTLAISGGSANFNGNSLVIVTNISLTGGTLSGTNLVTVLNQMTWSAGTMAGGGRTLISAGATLNLNSVGSPTLNPRVLDNAGTTIWTGTAGIVLGGGSVITNRPGAVFEVQNSATIGWNSGVNRLDNAGTFRKTGSSGSTSFQGNNQLNNYNIVELLTGTLQLTSGALNRGTITAAVGTTLDFSGGTFTSDSSASITGEGNLRVSGATVNLNGLIALTGSHTVAAGTANMNGDFFCTNNTLTISGGSANFNGNSLVIVSNLSLTSGALSGTNPVTVLNQMTWSAGTMAGGGRTVISAGATLNLNSVGSPSLNPRVLDNAGTTIWTGVAGIVMGGGSVITNRPGALFEVQNSATVGWNSSVNRLDNAGTFRKTGSSGTTSFQGNNQLNNYNNAELLTGTLQLTSGGLNQGTITAAAGTTLDFSGGTFTSDPSASIAGGGNLRVSGATVNLNGLVALTGSHTVVAGTANMNGDFICTNNTLTISGGSANFNGNSLVSVTNVNLTGGALSGANQVTVLNQMTWTGGTMSGGGRTIISTGATLNLNSVGSPSLNPRVLDNAGTTIWTGAGLVLGGGSVITNRPGALFEIQNSAAIGWNSSINRLDNAGTFRKTGSSGTTSFQGSNQLNNYNNAELLTGTVQLVDGGLNQGTITAAAGTTLDFAGGTFTTGSPASITGDGNLRVSGATLNINGLVALAGSNTVVSGTANMTGYYFCTNNTLTISGGTANFNGNSLVSVSNLSLTGGLLSGTNPVTVLNQMTWSSGTMSGGGRTLISAGATLNLNSLASPSLNPRILDNAGTAIWTGASGIVLGGGSVITNRPGPLFEIRNSQAFGWNSGANRLDNAGTLRKKGSSGTTTWQGANSLNNYATLEIFSGILAANNGYSSVPASSLFCALGGTTPGTGYGQLQSSVTPVLSGKLTVSLTNNFVPTTNNLFSVVSGAGLNGSFSAFYYPSNLVTMQVSNSSSAAIVRMTGISTNGPPAFFTDLPSYQVFYAGRTAVLPTSVAGSPPFTFQWQRNGTNLSDSGRINGSQTSALTITNFASADDGSYQLSVTNSQGFAQSMICAVNAQRVPKLNIVGAGWTLQGTTPPTMNSNNVTLTSGLGGTARTAFYNAPLFIGAFSSAFIYTDVGGAGADGVAFCIQNDSRAAAALGGGGPGLGYSGITPSAALAFNIFSPNTVGITICQNGVVPTSGGYKTPGSVNIASGNPIFVSLVYTGNVLQATLVESNTTHTFTTNYSINLSSVLGSQTAYVGFTGGDGGVGSTQVISNFTFVPLTTISLDRSDPAHPALWWPASIGGYAIQATPSLGSPWVDAGLTIVQTNSRNQATISLGSTNQFLRLSIPLNQ